MGFLRDATKMGLDFLGIDNPDQVRDDKEQARHQANIDRERQDRQFAESQAFARDQLAQQMALADRQLKQQQEFARLGVRWRVEDAQAAGLHPLSALGVNPASSQPVSVFPTSSTPTASAIPSQAALVPKDKAAGAAFLSSILSHVSAREREAHEMQMAEAASRIGVNDARRAALENQMQKESQVQTFPLGTAPQGLPLKPFEAEVVTKEGKLPTHLGNWTVKPGATAQTIEDLYGDIAQEVFGASKFIDDMGANFADVVRRYNPWWYRLLDAEQRKHMPRYDPNRTEFLDNPYP